MGIYSTKTIAGLLREKKKTKDWSATLAIVPNAGSSERKLNDTMAARCNRKFTNKITM